VTSERAEEGGKEKRPLASRASFNLIYLVFLPVPWIWQRPELIDIAAVFASIAFFVPLHFRGFGVPNQRRGLIEAWLILGLAFAMVPFNANAATYHIYASVRVAFLRPEGRAVRWLLVLAMIWCIGVFLLQGSWWDMGFGVLVGVLTGFQCIYGADQEEKRLMLERSRTHEMGLAAARERERIAGELHDRLGQTLTMVAVKADLAGRLVEDDPQRARQELADVRDAARRALQEMRGTVTGLAKTSVAAEIEQGRAALSTAGVAFTVEGDWPDLTQAEDHMLGLAVREAITNIVRHAGASAAVLCFDRSEDGGLKVTVRDDGRGLAGQAGLGLEGLKKRLEWLGGEAGVEDAPRGGAVVTMSLPSLRGAL
jgi:two-component system sensor histidine kinase DesK